MRMTIAILINRADSRLVWIALLVTIARVERLWL